MAEICHPDTTDWSCAYTPEEIGELDPVAKERSEVLAWTSLAALTGYQVATCPVLVRPCTEQCQRQTYEDFPVMAAGISTSFRPGLNNQGYWVNSCGCGSSPSACSCTQLSEVLLPGPVGGIVEVLVDGVVVSPANYRVDNSNRLVAQFDQVWPACQDMSLPETEDGTFSVQYWRGFAPNALTNYAAGILAVEFYKACQNDKSCRLPSGVTQVTRQGVSMQIQTGMWQGGWTGIREVDAVISTFNPNGLRGATVITSPDMPGARTPTWRS